MADLIVRILGESAGLTSELDKVKSHLSLASSGFSGMSKVAGIAGVALGGALVGGLVASVKAAEEGQASQAALDAAVKATGQSVAKTAGALDSAQSSARSYGFSNEDARTALAKLEIATGSTAKATKDLGAVMDLARFKHIDLATAAQVVARSMSGSTRAASQLGIAVIPVTTHVDALKAAYGGVTKNIPPLEMAQAKLQDKMATGAKAVAEMSAKVHGQAAAYRDTAAGGMAVFHAQLNNLEESIGLMLIPALTSLTQWVAKAATYFSEHSTQAKILFGALGALAVTMMAVGAAQKVMAAYTALSTAAMRIFTVATEEEDAALTANPIGIVVVALAALALALYEAWQHSSTFRTIVKAVFDGLRTDVMVFVTFFGTTLPDAFRFVINWVKGNWPLIAVLISGPFAPLVALATNAFGIRTALVGAFQNVLGWMQTLPGQIARAVGSGLSVLYQFGANLIQGIINGVTFSAGNLGSAIVHAITSHIPHGTVHIPGTGISIPYATGGIVPGAGNSDTVHARLTPGELILNAAQQANVARAISTPVMAPVSGGGSVNVNINVNGSVLSENDLIDTVRRGLVRVGQRNGSALGGFA